MKKTIALASVLALGIWQYSRTSQSKRRFIRELLRQIPWLVPRYFV